MVEQEGISLRNAFLCILYPVSVLSWKRFGMKLIQNTGKPTIYVYRKLFYE